MVTEPLMHRCSVAQVELRTRHDDDVLACVVESAHERRTDQPTMASDKHWTSLLGRHLWPPQSARHWILWSAGRTPYALAMSQHVSVVIRALNEAAHMGRLLASLSAQNRQPDEIVLVDSGSTDRTVEIAEQFDCRVIHMPPSEFTFGRSLNWGCDAAKGDLLIFVSAHVYPLAPDWLDRLIRTVRGPRRCIELWRPDWRPSQQLRRDSSSRTMVPCRGHVGPNRPVLQQRELCDPQIGVGKPALRRDTPGPRRSRLCPRPHRGGRQDRVRARSSDRTRARRSVSPDAQPIPPRSDGVSTDLRPIRDHTAQGDPASQQRVSPATAGLRFDNASPARSARRCRFASRSSRAPTSAIERTRRTRVKWFAACITQRVKLRLCS